MLSQAMHWAGRPVHLVGANAFFVSVNTTIMSSKRPHATDTALVPTAPLEIRAFYLAHRSTSLTSTVLCVWLRGNAILREGA